MTVKQSRTAQDALLAEAKAVLAKHGGALGPAARDMGVAPKVLRRLLARDERRIRKPKLGLQ